MKKDDVKRFPMTDTTLESLEPEAEEYTLPDSKELGLLFRVRPNGTKDWRFRYKNPLTNKWTWKGLGGYPKVSGKFARQKARELKERLSHGESIQEQKTSYAFVDLVNEWLEQRTVKANTLKRDKDGICRHIIPAFGDRDYRTIDTAEWLEQLNISDAFVAYADKSMPMQK